MFPAPRNRRKSAAWASHRANPAALARSGSSGLPRDEAPCLLVVVLARRREHGLAHHFGPSLSIDADLDVKRPRLGDVHDALDELYRPAPYLGFGDELGERDHLLVEPDACRQRIEERFRGLDIEEAAELQLAWE